MQSSFDFIESVNGNKRSILYKCRWSNDDAQRIVPELIRILLEEDHLLVDESLRALFVIGPPAITAAPHVAPLISSTYPITRRLAVLTLGQISHQRPDICIQPITKALKHDECCRDALRILIFLGSKATSALPEIVKRYESKDAKIRNLAVRAVAAIDGSSEMAHQLLTKAKTDRSNLVRLAAYKALKRLPL